MTVVLATACLERSAGKDAPALAQDREENDSVFVS